MRKIYCLPIIVFSLLLFPQSIYAIGSYGVNENSSVYGSENPYSSPQCTWYCWGRAKEKGTPIPTLHADARGWYTAASNVGLSVGTVARENSIVVFRGAGTENSNYGHVAFVEKINGNTAYLSESNYVGSTAWGKYWEQSPLDINSGVRYSDSPEWREDVNVPDTVKEVLHYATFS